MTPEDPDHGSGDAEVERLHQIAREQPGLWCQWVPCLEGCCLGWDGHEKFSNGARWLQYLMDDFLSPGAEASKSRSRQFRAFTFDHRMKGVIAGKQDNRELFLLRVVDSHVSREAPRAGDPMPWDNWWPSPGRESWAPEWPPVSRLVDRDERGAG